MNNNNVGKCGHAKCSGGNGCYEKGKPMQLWRKNAPILDRLEYLRTELRAERISTGELVELQSLTKHIAPDDVELLEAAGVSEHSEA